MKTVSLAIILSCLLHTAVAQNTGKSFEIGVNLVMLHSNSVNPYGMINNSSYVRPIEYVNGVFFRYVKNRWGLRAQAAYAQYYSPNIHPLVSSTYQKEFGGRAEYKEFRLGLGTQFALTTYKNSVYAFADAIYRNRFASGDYNDDVVGSDYTFTSSQNGFNFLVGLGYKIGLSKRLCLSPELAVDVFKGRESIHRNSLYSSQTSSGMSNQTNTELSLKLQLTYTF